VAQKKPACPMEPILKLLMGPWTTHIIWLLHTRGEMRFGSLKRELDGVSSKILTERLRMLEAQGIIYRHYEPTVPPAVGYGLTSKGHELKDVLNSLTDLALRWAEADAARPSTETLLPTD
jgi:DNA-binding HxlR family transcriptional regulator